MEFNELKDILQILIPSIGGVWFFYIYFKEGLHRPKMEFDISSKVIGQSESERIVEFQISSSNIGKVKVTFPELKLRIRGIRDSDALTYLGNTHRLVFPLKIFEENIIPEKYLYYYVEPGTTQIFSYTTKIDLEIKYVMVFAAIKYKQRIRFQFRNFRVVRETQTCERAFDLSMVS